MARVVLARQEFLEKETSQAPRIVANNTVLFEQVVEHDAIAEFLQFGNVDRDRFRAL